MPVEIGRLTIYREELTGMPLLPQETMGVLAVLEGLKITNALWAGITIFIIYKLVTWYRHYTAWVAVYDKLPGKREKHWLWGHIHEVSGMTYNQWND